MMENNYIERAEKLIYIDAEFEWHGVTTLTTLIADLLQRIDELEAELKDIKDSDAQTLSEECSDSDNRVHCTCVPALRAKVKELEAENSRLKHLSGIVPCMRSAVSSISPHSRLKNLTEDFWDEPR